MSYGSVKEKKVHPSLQNERDRIDFDKQELTTLLADGPRAQDRNDMAEFASKREIFMNTPDYYGKSREEKIEGAFKAFDAFLEFQKKKNMHLDYEVSVDLNQVRQGQFPLELHYWMFMPGIRNLASDD